MTGLLLTLALAAPVSGNTVTFLRNPSVTQMEIREMRPQKIALKTNSGEVDVYLPRHIAPGDTVSGSVFAVPLNGDWETEHRSFDELDRMYVRVGDQRVRVDKIMFTLRVQANASYIPVDVEDESGQAFESFNMDISGDTDVAGAAQSRIVESGAPVGVLGHFDGNRERTYASVDGHEVGVLAEGSQEVYVTSPVNHHGPIHLRVKEGLEIVNLKVSVLGFHFMGPATATDSGTHAALAVEVDGLQDADPAIFPLTVELRTDDPRVMSFDGPDRERYRLQVFPADVVDGHVVKGIKTKARKSGSYNITGTIYSASE